jgi:hypothetical protein
MYINLDTKTMGLAFAFSTEPIKGNGSWYMMVVHSKFSGYLLINDQYL